MRLAFAITLFSTLSVFLASADKCKESTDCKSTEFCINELCSPMEQTFEVNTSDEIPEEQFNKSITESKNASVPGNNDGSNSSSGNQMLATNAKQFKSATANNQNDDSNDFIQNDSQDVSNYYDNDYDDDVYEDSYEGSSERGDRKKDCRSRYGRRNCRQKNTAETNNNVAQSNQKPNSLQPSFFKRSQRGDASNDDSEDDSDDDDEGSNDDDEDSDEGSSQRGDRKKNCRGRNCRQKNTAERRNTNNNVAQNNQKPNSFPATDPFFSKRGKRGCRSHDACNIDQRCIRGSCMVVGCTPGSACPFGSTCVQYQCVPNNRVSVYNIHYRACTSNQVCQIFGHEDDKCVYGSCVPTIEEKIRQPNESIICGCYTDFQCPGDRVCVTSECWPAGFADYYDKQKPLCVINSDCAGGSACMNGACKPSFGLIKTRLSLPVLVNRDYAAYVCG